MAGIIYTIRNSVNGKIYVGQTTQSLVQRKAEHMTRERKGDRDHKLYLAMKKHGVDNFVFEEVCTTIKPEHLDALEIEIISQFNSYNRGYNSTAGGNGVSDETKEKLRLINLGRKITWNHKIVSARRANGTLSTPQPRGCNSKLALEYAVREPNGRCVRVNGLKAYCRANGLTFKAMYDTFNGLQHHHKGFTLMAKIPKTA